MPRLRATLWLFVLAAATFFRAAVAPETQTIHVGREGSFYDPQTVNAEINDMVVFEFDGLVIQGMFENPCFPLEGGFSSGMVSGPNTTSLPSTITLALTGPSAFATAPPGIPTTVVPASITTSSATSTSTSSSLSVTPPPTSIPTTTETTKNNSKLGGIIGGSVAGGVVLLAIVTYIIWVLLRRKRKRSRRGSQDFFNYRAQKPSYSDGPTDNLIASSFAASPKDNTHLLAPTTQSTPVSTPPATSSLVVPHPYSTATPRNSGPNVNIDSSPPVRTRATPPSSPPRPPLPPIPGIPQGTIASPRPPLPPIPSVLQRTEQKPPPPVVTTTNSTEDIHALARELAIMISQGQLNGARNARRDSFGRGESPGPPGYRTAAGA
ncbi:hypothetical protein C0989_001990 [Termitomyces sp. Mn162]|nr:hypothetical protein C0989_001990 [Termitomyces sp. Mn162]